MMDNNKTDAILAWSRAHKDESFADIAQMVLEYYGKPITPLTTGVVANELKSWLDGYFVDDKFETHLEARWLQSEKSEQK